ncbi:diacylglycerol kinase family lipid kinase [Chakrabartyella piscis]|uniref:diacylglycerol/lipid kinase family protein n=1 Tax=Chakrabartyella piscis TaxID=2918914 RepID=UPI00295875FC|nr:diacylglycerol kinase family lipid kinase [Chakrabartyella piscis]
MDRKKLLLIYNPHSGKGQMNWNLGEIVEMYTKNGYIVTVCPTQGKKDAVNLVTEYADQYEMIVCSGGDGTVSEIMNGLIAIDNPPLIGYIPSGTTNDFASSLGISKNIMTAAETVVEGMPFACDVGTFNGQAFGYIAAFGLFTDVSYQTPQEMKNVLGRMAYLLEGAKRLGHIPSYHLTVKTKTEIISGEFIYGMITNSTSIGGFKGLSGDKVKLDDGLFEVVLAKKPKNLSDIHALLQCVLTATPDPNYLYTYQTEWVAITSETPIDWTLDGEFGGSFTQVDIENHKQAVRIMIDR